jgi:hypothetical protein
MNGAFHETLAPWGNFYLLTGTGAAALTGLQFVVQTLLASDEVRPVSGGDPESGIAAFATPTVVHLSLALLISAVLCAPWPGFGSLRASLVIIGAGALIYSALVLQHARRQRSYKPVMEDWIWHFLLPAAAYGAMLIAALFLGRGAQGSLFVIAAATMLLLGIAIHNAWDTVTYFTINALRNDPAAGEAAPPPERGGSEHA